MVTTNDIINFAFTHKVFTRKELITYLQNVKQINSPSSLSEQLDRLLKSGLLIRLEHGVYSLPDHVKRDFSVVCSEEMQRINQQLKNQFPFVDYCLWSGSALMPYMHHIPNLSLIFVDVEREVAESVFNLLNSDSNKRVFLMPSLIDIERYIHTNEAIIIRPLITESPLQLVDGINTPAIEKILVDIVGDVEFSFLQGSEINYVYTTIFERHNVNKNKLLRYATRRGRKEEVEHLLNANVYDSPR
jgi:predicted transcriptional regulator of viral defense system